jgi:hypothetical protein
MARTKSILSQLTDVLDQMAELSKVEHPDKVKVSLLTSRLDTLRYLHQQEVAAEQNALAEENEKLKREVAELRANCLMHRSEPVLRRWSHVTMRTRASFRRLSL